MSAAATARRHDGRPGVSAPAARRAKAIATTGTPGSASSRSLDAFIVAINQATDMGQWYTATKELQLASLELCRTCRSAHTVHLRVDGDTPSTLLASVCADADHGGRLTSRVPQPRARVLTWEQPSLALLGDPIETFADTEELYFGCDFKGTLTIRAWPHKLRVMDFGWLLRLEQRIAGDPWPLFLLELTFWTFGHFDQPIEGVKLPMSLVVLIFGSAFNQPIEGVAWPPSLKLLFFGRAFNQPIESVKWPTTLQELVLYGDFSQPIELVAWPASLTGLVIGEKFNQPIERVAWPPSLQRLSLGPCFNQTIEGASWPTSFRELVLSGDFNQPIEGVIWPPSLESIDFGENFNQPIEGVQLLVSLRQLTLRGCFRQSLRALGTTLPSLERLTLRLGPSPETYAILRDIEWPAELTHLIIGAEFHLEGVSIPSRVSVIYDESFE
ncbi:unnamed protein product [Scytosiphon promiscuus]